MNKQLTRAALLLAVALVAQGLRFILPLPGMLSMFIIGTIVNMCIVLMVMLCGVKYAVAASFIFPLVAYLQGQLPLVPLIPVVFLGNLVLSLVVAKVSGFKLLILGPLLKALTMWAATGMVLELFHVQGIMARSLQFMLSWPQIITALAGIIVARLALSRIKNS
jgi:hypothetical protein